MARIRQWCGLLLQLAATWLVALVCLRQLSPSWWTPQAPNSAGGPLRTLEGDALVWAGVPRSEEVVAALAAHSWARPWFVAGGSWMPHRDPAASSRLWPHQAPDSDRIIEQLLFVPPPSDEQPRIRKVLVYHGMVPWWGLPAGRDGFQRCPVSSCTFTDNKTEASVADAILFHGHFVDPGVPRPTEQVWILFQMECPGYSQPVEPSDVFNWTITYRRDSDIVQPYCRWMYYDRHVRQKTRADVNYAANKTKKVAWFVSKCNTTNERLQYAHELQKHIQVDIFGKCGTKECSPSNRSKCFEMLRRDYKFYLAFENSNCKEYITEKFYRNALQNDVLPVVMGARPEDYARYAPEHSYIHVDDFASAQELAAYLHQLDTDDELYNSYFRWKGTGELIDRYFHCRLCAVLHDDFPTKSYPDINEWWRGPGTCTSGSWRKAPNE